MSRIDAAAVVIRLVAVWLLVRALGYMVQAFTFGGPDALHGSAGRWFAALLAALIGASVGLWVLAPRLATVLLPREASTEAAASISVETLEEAAFSVVGLYLLVSAVPEVGYWAAYVYQSTKMNPGGFNPSIEMYASIVRRVLLLAVGLYLLLGSRGLVTLVHRLRGTSPTAGTHAP